MTVPGHDAAPAAGGALEALRAAVADLPPAGGPDDRFDAAEHAERFEAVHDALAAVLADVDRA
jgi:hypothetical protein